MIKWIGTMNGKEVEVSEKSMKELYKKLVEMKIIEAGYEEPYDVARVEKAKINYEDFIGTFG